ncbi:MAG: hypothetical protein K2G27_05840 [Duncaniella sp.]|nr:hypothetical protein [Duncaniella sp.]
MKNSIIFLIILLSALLPGEVTGQRKADRTDRILGIIGTVKDKVTGRQLPDARVILFNHKGEPVDTISCRHIFTTKDNEKGEFSEFYVAVSRSEGTITLDVECDGYNTYTVVKDLSAVHPRETYISLPPIMLERAPRKLKEVTVTASKVKFYNRGDTIVYNADAFQLAEGSMLDELITQLPGVEIKDGGAIYVNGEYVESLLLNGRDFFNGRNELMLENIGAYTVKNIEVYRGQTKEEKWRNDSTELRHLTMDVKLKKEYTMGYMANLQAGAGTDSRYLGRMFTQWFSPTLILQLIGSINNVSDSRKPGKNDSWTPESMPKGTMRHKTLGLNYDYQSKSETLMFNGYLTYEEDRTYTGSSNYRTNFLTGGDTYEYSFADARTRNLKFDSRQYLRHFSQKWMSFGMLSARWSRRNTSSDQAGASFREEQEDMTRQTIEALYSDGSPERLDAVINRSLSRTDGVRTSAEVQGFAGLERKLTQPGARLYDELGFKYRTDSDRSWKDYLVDYGADQSSSTRRRNFTKVRPNHTLTLINNLTYNLRLGRKFRLELNYEYRFIDTRKNSSMYALDRLADMGIYGVLPENWAEAFDPSNSFMSHTLENKNTLSPKLSSFMEHENWGLYINISPELGIHHRHLNYWSDSRDYRISRNSAIVNLKSGRTSIGIPWGPQDRKKSLYNTSLNFIEYTIAVESMLPDLLHMVDVINDANPLYIDLGNPDLKTAYVTNQSLSWKWRPARLYANNTLALRYATTANALVRGYTYDTSTGVRTNRTYNVDGNNSLSASNHFNRQFGSTQQFTVSSITQASTHRSADMIGVDQETPTRSTVRNRTLSQELNLSWQIGKQSLSAQGSISNQHTTSTRTDFRTINANHFKYGLAGQFRLPGGVGISTNFTVYGRRGYGVSQLDTTDKIWDMRVSYTLGKGRWVIMADAFDLLHQLSNVNYAVTATGRSVVYTNTIPRYMMLSVQYRFNHNPKKISDTHIRRR